MCKVNDGDVVKKLQEELKAARQQIERLQAQNKELKRLAITDELTGLYNRRYFYEKLGQEVIRNKRQSHPLSLILFDVDGLKIYNDTYGHSGGDAVLRSVSFSLSKSIRENVDSGYRYGGDEFAAIIPEAKTDQAVEIAKRIIDNLPKTKFQDVTLSFGVAGLTTDIDGKTLFERADKAMYTAKNDVNIKIHIYDIGNDEYLGE